MPAPECVWRGQAGLRGPMCCLLRTRGPRVRDCPALRICRTAFGARPGLCYRRLHSLRSCFATHHHSWRSEHRTIVPLCRGSGGLAVDHSFSRCASQTLQCGFGSSYQSGRAGRGSRLCTMPWYAGTNCIEFPAGCGWEPIRPGYQALHRRAGSTSNHFVARRHPPDC